MFIVKKQPVYCYTWLRESGEPFYVGVGVGDRAFTRKGHNVSVPSRNGVIDYDRIIVVEHPNLRSAFEAERVLIETYGLLKDGGTLRNRINGHNVEEIVV